jgi:NhaP-type Na+/H+ or K+/H+ antiporter
MHTAEECHTHCSDVLADTMGSAFFEKDSATMVRCCCAEGAHGADHGEHGIQTVSMVFFVFFSLLIGAIVRQYLAWLPVPYTVILLVFGLVLGALAEYWFSDNELIVSFVDKASEMDPHLLLHIFLPPLLFESAFSIDFHIFRKTGWKVALLAIPGLLMNTFMMAWVSSYIFGRWDDDDYSDQHGIRYKWEFPEHLLLGGILSATDPVAVVALLRDLGASKKLATLIEGESLMNDGTAVVFFIVLQTRELYYNPGLDPSEEFPDGYGGYQLDWSGILSKFLQMSLGGAFFGWFMGNLAQFCMTRVFNDPMVEITLTLTFAYLTFFLAENYLIVSGVLAVCFLGLTFAEHGAIPSFLPSFLPSFVPSFLCACIFLPSFVTSSFFLPSSLCAFLPSSFLCAFIFLPSWLPSWLPS